MKSPTAAKYQQEYCGKNAPVVVEAPPRPVVERVSKFAHIWNDRIIAVRSSLPADLPSILQLNPHSIIRNPALFIETHLSICEFNNGNPRFLIYLERLEQVVEMLEKENAVWPAYLHHHAQRLARPLPTTSISHRPFSPLSRKQMQLCAMYVT